VRAVVFAASLVVIGASATFASSLSPGDIGDTFCAARLSGDMTAVTPLLSPKLAAAIADTKNDDIRWQGVPEQAAQCMVVGSSGTLENPEAVLFYQGSASWSDRLVLTFVDGELRIDDILYADGGRLSGD
jgi:hypothetical protein